MEVVAIVCQKGGVGKSTTAVNLAAGLARLGNRVLSIDLDQQGNMTKCLSGDYYVADFSTRQLLMGEVKYDHLPNEVLQQKLVVVPSRSDMITLEDDLANLEEPVFALKNAVNPFSASFDYAVIDTAPSLGKVTLNALACATRVIIPLNAADWSFVGLNQLSVTLNAVYNEINPDFVISGILVTQYFSRTGVSKGMLESYQKAAEDLQTSLFKTKIRHSVVMLESQIKNKDIFAYAPNSNVAKDCANFVKEFCSRLES